jgi:hypothetical protein
MDGAGQPNLRITIIAADGLYKRDVFRFPDPFAVATINGEQTRTTSVIKKTLNPYWNESFDMYAALGLGLPRLRIMTLTHDTGKSTKRAFWRFRSLTRRSSRRRTRASWASSMSA